MICVNVHRAECMYVFVCSVYCVSKKVSLKPLHAFMSFDEVSFSFTLSLDERVVVDRSGIVSINFIIFERKWGFTLLILLENVGCLVYKIILFFCTTLT